MVEFKTVEECLKAGIKWSDCIKMVGISSEGAPMLEISKTCPIPMKEKMRDGIFKGKTTYSVED